MEKSLAIIVFIVGLAAVTAGGNSGYNGDCYIKHCAKVGKRCGLSAKEEGNTICSHVTGYCTSPYKGKCISRKSEGGICYSDDECKIGLSCDWDTKRCHRPPEPGEKCNANCAQSHDPAMIMDCENGICVNQVTIVGVGEKCDNSVRLCESGLYCDTNGYDDVCTQRTPAGGDCIFDEECEEGTVCIQDPRGGGSGMRQCIKYFTFNEGDPCDENMYLCKKDLTCQMPNKTSGLECMKILKRQPIDCQENTSVCDTTEECMCDYTRGTKVCVPRLSVGELYEIETGVSKLYKGVTVYNVDHNAKLKLMCKFRDKKYCEHCSAAPFASFTLFLAFFYLLVHNF